MRTQGRYTLDEQIQAGIGFTYALQYPQDHRSKSDLVVPELRGQQDITLKQTIGKASLNHRYMIEERFIRKVQEQELLPGYIFNFRFRYRLQAEIQLLKKEVQNLGLVLYDEAMLNLGKSIVKNVFDQNRIYAGLKWGVLPSWAVEAGYLHWFQQRASGSDFFSRDIARLSIYHKITLVKNDK
jgi:PIN domain nuclease of toxin-antitoxin system